MGFIGLIETKYRRPFLFFFWRSTEFGQKNRFQFGEDLFFWRSLENPEKSEPFFLPVLDRTKPEMHIIRVDPRPTLGSRRPCSRRLTLKIPDFFLQESPKGSIDP